MSQTSVTSVTSTDQGQIILPERQGAYKRRQLDGFDTWIYDKKTNEGYTEDNIKFLTFIHNDIYNFLYSCVSNFNNHFFSNFSKNFITKILFVYKFIFI